MYSSMNHTKHPANMFKPIHYLEIELDILSLSMRPALLSLTKSNGMHFNCCLLNYSTSLILLFTLV